MTALVALPVVVPLVGASLSVLASPWRWAQRAISLLALSANVVVSVMLLADVDGDEMLVMQAGG